MMGCRKTTAERMFSLFAVAMMLTVAFAIVDAEGSDATASSEVVDAFKITSLTNTSTNLIDSSDGSIWATVSLGANFKTGSVQETISVYPVIKMKQAVWYNGNGVASEADVLLITQTVYYDSGETTEGLYGYCLNNTKSTSTVYTNEYSNTAKWSKSSGMNKMVWHFCLADKDNVHYTEYGELSFTFTFTYTSLYKYTTEIVYDLNGGSGGPTSSTTYSNTSQTALDTVSMTISTTSDMSRDKYVFAGWATSKGSTVTYQPGKSVSVPRDRPPPSTPYGRRTR